MCAVQEDVYPHSGIGGPDDWVIHPVLGARCVL